MNQTPKSMQGLIKLLPFTVPLILALCIAFLVEGIDQKSQFAICMVGSMLANLLLMSWQRRHGFSRKSSITAFAIGLTYLTASVFIENILLMIFAPIVFVMPFITWLINGDYKHVATRNRSTRTRR